MIAARTGCFVVLACACGPVVADPGDAGTSSTGTVDPSTTVADTGSSSPGTSATTTPGTSADTSMTTVSTFADSTGNDEIGTCGFIPEACVDWGTPGLECDLWLQDCPEGEKCMPWANDGGPYWNATRCAPVDPSPREVGEDCLVEGSHVSGIDNCRKGAQCLFVDPETNAGVCVANCDGSAAAPLCADPTTACTIEFDEVVHLCLPTCDPLADDCMENAACVPTHDDGIFVCAPVLQIQAEHDPCESAWDCLPGFTCMGSDADSGCSAESCCVAFCDLMLGDVYCEGESCVPWFPEGQAPPGHEDVGICVG